MKAPSIWSDDFIENIDTDTMVDNNLPTSLQTDTFK